jgi:SAM-dependent MidA family methyltransferase
VPGAASEDFDWQPFIGRTLGFLCLHLADMRSRTVLEQAEFLMGLGLPRREAATILGSSDESLRVLARSKAKKIAAKGAN